MSTVDFSSVLFDVTNVGAVTEPHGSLVTSGGSEPLEILKSGESLQKQSKVIIFNVYNALKVSKPHLKTAKLIQEVVQCTNISKRTVYRILKEGPTSPVSRGRSNSGIMAKLDTFDEDVIRRAIYKFYSEAKLPTIAMLHEAIKQLDPKYGMCKKTLACFVKKRLHFTFKVFERKNIVMESPRIRTWRCQYLDQISAARKAEKLIVFLDETWFDTQERLKRCWTDDTENSVLNVSSARGKRLLLLHAGGKEGWVSSECFFISGKNIADCSADYHADMNSEVFESWFKDILCPLLPEPAVIVMDNASYHSRLLEKIPNSSWTKANIIGFLTARGVQIPDPVPFKPILLKEVRKMNLKRSMAVDEIAAQAGHEVLRLPPYHCVFNPIEMVWSYIKGHVRRHNVDPTNEPKVIALLREAAELVTPELWRNYVAHTEKKEKMYRPYDQAIDEAEDGGKIIIQLNDSDEESDFSFSECDSD